MSVTKCVRIKDKRKQILYRAEVYVRGIRLDDQVFQTKAAAHAWHDLRKGKLLMNPKANAQEVEMTFSDCLDKYLEYAKSKVKWSTFQVYENRLPYLQCKFLSKLRVTEISSEIIDLWLDWLIKHPTASNKGRKNFNKEIEILSTVLNWYKNYQNAAYVFPITKKHREKAVYKTVQARRTDYFARPNDVRAWIGWLREHRPIVYANLATFLVLTGCRVGEACAMKWDAIDLELKMARVFRSIQWDHHTKSPSVSESVKTEDSNRVVLLPELLVNQLKEMKSLSDGKGYLFPGRKGDALRYNAIQSAFNAGFVALGLPWRSTHICRHTYATIALFATRDLGGVQASLGHSKQAMTEKYAKAVALLNSGTAEKTAAAFDLSLDHAGNHATGTSI